MAFAVLMPHSARSGETEAQRGYRLLRTKAFLPPDFDEDVFTNLWKRWPKDLREQASEATPEQRRKMTMSYYGIMPAPENDGIDSPALGYLSDGQGGWIMNCLACHGGKVAGKVIPGLPNSHYLLQTLTEDVRATKLATGKPLSHMDLGSLKMGLGGSRGTTNAVMFGVALGSLRDKDMNLRLDRVRRQTYIDHDLDAPPLWHAKKKKKLYYDAFAPKNHRVLMQFVLLPRNTRDVLESWEPDFKAIQAWIESLEAPQYPWPIDKQLAAQGEQVFTANCSRCHGTYGEKETYPNRVVALDDVGTDPVRVQALTTEHRRWMQVGWLSRYGDDEVVTETKGYIAPPLDGIWATAPYFHNGSVPTLWHVLHSNKRPAVWRRTEDGYDRDRVGLEITEYDSVPADSRRPPKSRDFFKTSLKGKSAAGHTYPDDLTPSEKQALLEYLKTL